MIEDKDVIAVTVMVILMAKKRSLRMAGVQFRNNIFNIDFLLVNPCLPFEGNELLIPLIPYMVTLTLAYPWVEG